MNNIASHITPIMVSYAVAIIWIIGSRGVSQIMGSPMGASIMSSKQAVMISAVFGLIGVLISGHHVSATYQAIVFLDVPQATTQISKTLLLFVVTVFSWMYIARRNYALFSCSYGVVSALVSATFFGMGHHAVNWPLVTKILIAWLVSPFINYFMTIFIYRIIHTFIVKRKNAVHARRQTGSWIVFIFISLFSFIVYHSGVAFGTGQPSLFETLLVACGFGALFGGIAYVVIGKASAMLPGGYVDAESSTEGHVKYLALLIVFVLPFSLGANNVANGIGPLLLHFKWIADPFAFTADNALLGLLFAGGVVLVSGLLFSGLQLVDEMGRKFTELTPIRSLSIIISTSLILMFGTGLGMPLSTFHTIAGGVLAFSYLSPSFEDVGKIEVGRFIGSFFIPWFLTIPGTFFVAGFFHSLLGLL